MTVQPVVLPPGFSRRSTGVLVEGRWFDGDKVRSVGGVIETMGGWDKYDEDVADAFVGVARMILAWRALDDTKLVAIGTHRRLYVHSGGTLANATPVRASGTLGADPLTTVSGSAVVTVAHTAHGLQDNAYATAGGAAAVGGITPDGEYEVTVVDPNKYEITHSSAASSTATGGGASVTYSYEINPGLADNIDGFGWGVGPWGEGTWGTPRTGVSVLLRARTWALWKYGEDVIACPRDGSIYQYDKSVGGKAALLANAPTNNVGVFVAPERHVVAIGAGDNRMSVEWSDIDDNTVWTPGATNQAGSKQIEGGSEIIAGGPLRAGFNLIWTDTALHRMVYLGQEPWYSFRREAGSGIIGPNAWAELDGIAYWMQDGNFYEYDGFVRELPNQDDIRNYVFARDAQGVDRDQGEKVFAFVSVLYREIWWLYQSWDASSDEIDRYILFNVDERVWYFGTMERTCWDPARVLDYPVACATDGYIYNHEKGADADGNVLNKSITSSWFDLGNGRMNMDLLGFWPDFDEISGDINLTILTADSPQMAKNAPRSDVRAIISTTSDNAEDFRGNGKHAQIELLSQEVGGKFRLGRNSVIVQPAGRREAE